MSRIQFYPDPNLSKRLHDDAAKHGVAVSTLVTELLNRHYGLAPMSKLSEGQLTEKVFHEIEAYIEKLKKGDEFDLLSASATFAGIEMEYAGKPSVMRAKIGKHFARAVGKPGAFQHVAVKTKPNGKIKRNQNNAAIYEKLSGSKGCECDAGGVDPQETREG